jgi:4-amino-4-deoxy-L-arabinose transferase-like glycosyltransferase
VRSVFPSRLFLAFVCFGAFLLWLPDIHYPVVSDSINYAFLGESVWTSFTYAIHGIMHTKFLPMYPILSYPFVWIFGYSVGMKVASLLSGMGVLIASYVVLRKLFSESVARLSVIAILLQPGFITMTMLGASDLLCTLFFLLSLLCYLHAEKHPRFYWGMGLFLGLSLLTRYNVVPLFLFYPLLILIERRKHLTSPYLWSGLVLGGALFSLWFIRKALLFGSPFANDYTQEFATRTIGVIPQAIQNLVYYLDPFKNILPILFVLALYELIRRRAKPYTATGSMAAAWVLFLFWPVRNLRYAFPGYILLIGFGVSGLLWLLKKSGRYRVAVGIIIFSFLLTTHLLSICLYTYGQCNALFDRYVGVLPKNMGLTSEGFYTWDQARQYINTHAETGAIVRYETAEALGLFRSDLRASQNPKDCPAYSIKQILVTGEKPIYQTSDEPVTYVVREGCRKR